jgi:predicted transcriptional regulator of viral defense system
MLFSTFYILNSISLPTMTTFFKYNSVDLILINFQSKGKYSFTIEELLLNSNASKPAIQQQLKRLKNQTKIALIKKSFYVIVKPEYIKNGYPPYEYYLANLMESYHKNYYLGLLNACSYYGATLQQPQNISIIYSGTPIKSIQKGSLSLTFISKKNIDFNTIKKIKTNVGFIPISSPELTVLDLCYYQKASGGLDNVCTVIDELVVLINEKELLKEAEKYFSLMAVQRLGFILDFLHHTELANALHKWFENKKSHVAMLETKIDRPSSKITGNRWKIMVNTKLNPDI